MYYESVYIQIMIYTDHYLIHNRYIVDILSGMDFSVAWNIVTQKMKCWCMHQNVFGLFRFGNLN